MATFTDEEVLTALEEVVKERGEDYVYPRETPWANCYYSFADGTPACIVGTVINKLDPEAFNALFDAEGGVDRDNDRLSIGASSDALHFTGIHVAIGVEWALRAAQVAQDSGNTWGEALKKAKLHYSGEGKTAEL